MGCIDCCIGCIVIVLIAICICCYLFAGNKDNKSQCIEVLKLFQPIIIISLILYSIVYLVEPMHKSNVNNADKRLHEINNSISEIKKILKRSDINGSKKVSPATINSQSHEKKEKNLDENDTSKRIKHQTVS